MKKILMLAANPRNTTRLHLDEEVREIRLALERAPKRNAFQLIPIGAVRSDDLRQQLLFNKPQIVHFSGHGVETDGLVLENNSGGSHIVSTTALSDLFARFKEQIECVILNACYSETQAEAIHRHIDCVIGMGQPIQDHEAINFSKGFYDALFSGRNYSEAFDFGRINIDLNNTSSNTSTNTPTIRIRPADSLPPLSVIKQRDKVSIPIEREDCIQIIYPFFQNISLLSPGSSCSEDITLSESKAFDSNKGFWDSILAEKASAFDRVNLNKFQILNWYPHSPGLFHTENAQRIREETRQSATKEKGVLVYPPDGKYSMIQGGIGSIRFKTRKIQGEDCWLSTATSDGYCHSGIPLAIPTRLINNNDFNSGIYFFLSGKVMFLDNFLSDKVFTHLLRIPRRYILVEKISKIDIAPTPTYITPMVFFKSYESSYKVAYMICEPNPKEISHAIKWIEDYVEKYSGTIITDFDETCRAFAHTEMTLGQVMQGSASVMQLSSPHRDMSDLIEAYRAAAQKFQKLGILPTQNQ